MKHQAVLIVAGLIASVAATAEMTCAATMSLDAPLEVSTSVNSDSQDTSYGSEIYMNARKHTSPQYLSYLRFDLSDLPANATVTSATFKVYEKKNNGTAGQEVFIYLYGLNDNVAGETDFSGSTLTWNTRPDGTGGVPNTATTSLLAKQNGTEIGKKEFDGANVNSGADLLAFINADTNHKIVFIVASDDNSGVLQFTTPRYDSAAVYQPTLHLEYEVVPEPASMGMMLLGGAGLLLKRWR